MFDKLQDFFLDKIAGKLLLRAGIVAASYLASGKLGTSVSVDPAEITALLSVAGHWLLDLYKNRRSQAKESVPIVVPSVFEDKPVAVAPQNLAAKEPLDIP